MRVFLEKLCFLMFLEKPDTKAPEIGRMRIFLGTLCFLMFLGKPSTQAPELGLARGWSHGRLPRKVVFSHVPRKASY